ncbi:MAG: MFS transporter [Clostridium sp.]|nr:MFS transporter [Clostridium sp.]
MIHPREGASLVRKVGYGLGDMSSSMFWKIFSYFLPFFYSNIFGLTLTDAGFLMLITRIWDAVSDPMMGIIADRTKTRWGKYRPYLLWIAVPFAVCGVLLFTTPDAGYIFKLVWAYATYILMMTIYTAINVPYGAMLDVMTPSSSEKTVFSSYRMFFAYVGSFIALLAWEPLCRFFSGVGADAPLTACSAQSWQMAMCVIALACCVLFVGCFLLTREVIDSPSKASVGHDLSRLLVNKPWWIMNFTAISCNFFNIIRGSAVAYLFANIISDNVEIRIVGFIVGAGVFLCIGELVNMVGVLLAIPFANRYGKKNTFIASLAVIAISSVAFIQCPVTVGGLWAMVLLQVIFSVAMGVISPLIWSMYADVANYSELINKTASTGLIFSSASMAQKFGSAFGGSAVMWILAAFEYNAEVTVQTDAAVTGIWYMMSIIPAAFAVIAIILMSVYPLTTRRINEIEADLAVQRQNQRENG